MLRRKERTPWCSRLCAIIYRISAYGISIRSSQSPASDMHRMLATQLWSGCAQATNWKSGLVVTQSYSHWFPVNFGGEEMVRWRGEATWWWGEKTLQMFRRLCMDGYFEKLVMVVDPAETARKWWCLQIFELEEFWRTWWFCFTRCLCCGWVIRDECRICCCRMIVWSIFFSSYAFCNSNTAAKRAWTMTQNTISSER